MLSVTIIVRNEEKRLAKCLDSVKDIADEIVLLDTGSDDDTLQIAENFGCRIYETIWNDNFADMRNIALSKAIGEFILYIDADEILINPNEIKKTLNSVDRETGGWLVDVQSVSESKQVNSFSNYQVRLFRNHDKIRFEGAIHEQIVHSIKKIGLKINKSAIVIKHFGYNLNKTELTRKQVRNLKILNRLLDKNPNDSYCLINRAKTYYALEDYDNAEKDINILIQLVPDSNLEKVSVYNYGALISNKLNDKKHALSRAINSTKILKEQFLGNFIAAEILFENNLYDKAIKYYINSINFSNRESNKIVGDIMVNNSEIYYKTGVAYIKTGKLNMAEEHFRKGIESKKNDLKCLTGLANVLFKQKKYDSAYQILIDTHRLYPSVQQIKEFIDKVQPFTNFKDTKPVISLSMIVKNEEKFLEGALKSVEDIADEIIIVDTGSTDKTKEIAGKYTDKIYDFEWIDDFSAARNEGLKHCTGDWILYMDADERLKIGNKESFFSLLKSLDEEIGALVVTIESDHSKMDGSSEKHRGGYPRIFRNFGYPNIQFKGRVHEQIANSILDLNKSFINTNIIIEHLGYNRDYNEMDKKIRRNYNLLLQHVKEEPLNSYAWYQLGQTLARMKLNSQAEDAVKFAINLGDLSDSVLASAYATLSQMTGNRKEFSESLKYAELSLEKAPEQIYSLNLKAYSLLYLGRFDEAEKIFNDVLDLMNKKRGVPKTGFDIDIPASIPKKGLQKAKAKDNSIN